MPVYNFDPSEDGEDWETELLDENIVSPNGQGKSGSTSLALGGLKLDTGLTGGLKIKNSAPGLPSSFSNPNHPGSPTPSSGLLTSSGSGSSTARQLYTSERNQMV